MTGGCYCISCVLNQHVCTLSHFANVRKFKCRCWLVHGFPIGLKTSRSVETAFSTGMGQKNTFMSGTDVPSHFAARRNSARTTLLPFDYQTSIIEDDLIADESLLSSRLCIRFTDSNYCN